MGWNASGCGPGLSAWCLGRGPTGLLLAQLIKSGGAASVTVAAPSRFKLDRARAFGIDHTIRSRAPIPLATSSGRWTPSGGRGYDIVVEATGATEIGDICVG